jgi:hypothetical protein
VGGFADDEIPLLVMLFYLFRGVESVRPHGRAVLASSTRAIYAEDNVRWGVWLGRHIC